jgi:uncharacterized protein YkwD
MNNIKNSLPQYLWKVALTLGGISVVILIWRTSFDSSRPSSQATPEAQPIILQFPTAAPIVSSTPANGGLLPTSTPTPAPPTLTPTPIPVYYIVEQGDVAVAIAAKYGITVDLLLAANNITDPTRLQIGQRLLIPVTVTPPPAATPTPTLSPTPTLESTYHVVQAGDTLLAIATQYDTTVAGIMLANDLSDPRRLSIGQELMIPPQNSHFNLDTPITIHEIEPGDTIATLAGRYGSRVDDILTANPELQPTSLQIGQKIIIPVTQAPPVTQVAKPALPAIIFPDEPPPNLVALEQEIIQATNAQRQAQGLPPYTTDHQLTIVARAHAQDMATRGYFGHASPEGQWVRDRLRNHGVQLNWVGENILYSTRSADETPRYAINWFMSDRPHRLNLLHAQYNNIGVGVAQDKSGWYIIVQVFAER